MSLKMLCSMPPNTGIGVPGLANCQRMAIIRQNPKKRKAREVMPYWIPMILWSVEKMYFRQNPSSSWWA